ncbi:lysophospholipase [candidate division KSB1 bacterium]|nr:lysophospholipase [candidate division KSB1 bacterium]RQW08821.1 MAG: alpha/beta hydrolase [candidate division KSB1 bacterium]
MEKFDMDEANKIKSHQQLWLTNKDGLKIFSQAWLPQAEPRANLIIVHGLGEHSGRYAHVARYFNERGLAVFALDLPGHGLSEGKRGHVNNFVDFIDVLEQLRGRMIKVSPGKPTFLFGHSMGGTIALIYLLDYQHHIRAAVLSAPAIQIKMGPPTFIKELVPKLAAIAPSLTINSGLKPAWISRDKDVVAAYRTDPLVHPHISLSLFSGMYNGGKHALANAEKVNIPVFALYGSNDVIIQGSAVDAAFDKLASHDKKKLVFADNFHEVHNEAEQFVEFAAIWDWLKPKCE